MLALIAGRGDLPAAIADAQEARPLVAALEGYPPRGLEPDLTFRIETLGTLLLELGKRGVGQVCFCGQIDRPAIDPAKLDDETKPLVPIFMKALQQGDDGALRAVMEIFEQTGFIVRGAHELLPDLTLSAGVLTEAQPEARHKADAKLGDQVLAEMGEADLGQACVLRDGAVLAREDEAGTDAMLAQFAEEYVPHQNGHGPLDWALNAADWLANPLENLEEWLLGVEERKKALAEAAPGAILFKGSKPGQDLRSDMATIGPATAINAAEAGLDGIVIEAGRVLVLDKAHVVQVLDAMDMFLWVRG